MYRISEKYGDLMTALKDKCFATNITVITTYIISKPSHEIYLSGNILLGSITFLIYEPSIFQL